MIRMAIQVVFIDEANDRRDVHEIVGIDRGQLCPAVLGLSLAEAKTEETVEPSLANILASRTNFNFVKCHSDIIPTGSSAVSPHCCPAVVAPW
jgi:hypothetical protein